MADKKGGIKMAIFLGALIMPFFAFAQNAPSREVLSVPFVVQAPFGNWAEPWQSFCEEASAVMAAHFVSRAPAAKKDADAEMRSIQAYEKKTFGRYKDNSAGEMARVLTDFLKLKNVRIKEVRSAEDLKKELAGGNMLIVPAAGRLLKNPYFRPPGPLYHMLVVKGFDGAKRTFITNDPGTRRGENLAYDQAILFNAIHDWNNGDVMNGKKTAVVVGK